MANFAYRVFSEVAKQKTFVSAANVLNVTPSAISHSISGLEEELGFALFVRNRTGIMLTPDGEKVLPIVQEILNSEAKLNEEAARIKGLNQGSIRIGAFSSVCINWLPDVINAFKKNILKLRFQSDRGLSMKLQSQSGLAVLKSVSQLCRFKKKLSVLPLYKDRIYCVAPEGFVPENGKTVVASDVCDETFILQQIDYDRDTKKALDAFHVSLNSIQYSIDDASIIAMVESGLGFGILPELALQNFRVGWFVIHLMEIFIGRFVWFRTLRANRPRQPKYLSKKFRHILISVTEKNVFK